MPNEPATDPRPLIAYRRVSTREQDGGMEVQRVAILREAAARGWSNLLWIEDPGYTGGNANRPGLDHARDLLRSGVARGLVVSKMDRLSRSLQDFANLVAEAKTGKWTIVCLDVGLDLSTKNGRLQAGMLMTVAEWERETISERIKEALAVKRDQGVRLGRPSGVDVETARRIRRKRRAGASYRAIADWLNAQGVPTGQGGKQWHAATVRGVLLRHEAHAQAG